MNVTHIFTPTSKNAQYMRYDYEHARGTVYSRYGRPSQTKIQAWNNIVDAYNYNNGIHTVRIHGVEHTLCYCDDIRVVGASSHFFSTIASFEDLDTGVIYLIKETHANTYMCEL